MKKIIFSLILSMFASTTFASADCEIDQAVKFVKDSLDSYTHAEISDFKANGMIGGDDGVYLLPANEFSVTEVFFSYKAKFVGSKKTLDMVGHAAFHGKECDLLKESAVSVGSVN